MRSIVIDRRHANRTLLEVLQSSFKLRRKNALAALRKKQVRVCGGVCLDPARRVKAGQNIQIDAADKPKTNQPSLPPIARRIIVRHVDKQVIVVEKPAGLTTVRHADEIESHGKRAKKFLPPTLVDLLPMVLAHGEQCPVRSKFKSRIRAVHRIDKETSGL